jgi:hypothetical protein
LAHYLNHALGEVLSGSHESYRNEWEQFDLQYWPLAAESFLDTRSGFGFTTIWLQW